jgi:hypothetical protein
MPVLVGVIALLPLRDNRFRESEIFLQTPSRLAADGPARGLVRPLRDFLIATAAITGLAARHEVRFAVTAAVGATLDVVEIDFFGRSVVQVPAAVDTSKLIPEVDSQPFFGPNPLRPVPLFVICFRHHVYNLTRDF